MSLQRTSTIKRSIVLLVALLVAAADTGATGVSAAGVVGIGQAVVRWQDTEVTNELPPPDLPASNPQGYTYTIKSTLKADESQIPTEAPVYAIERDPMSEKQAQKITNRLEIGADVESRGNSVYAASGNGEVYLSPDLIQYFSLAQIEDGDLPTDEDAVAFAQDWLRLKVLAPKDIGEGVVVARSEETNRVVVLFTPKEPVGVLSAYPSIVVTLGPGGTVIEASSRWADVVRGDVYQLRPVDEAWNEVKSGEAFIEAQVPEGVIEPGGEVVGKATYDSVEIAYTTAGPPGGAQYLEPIYVFVGRLQIDGQEGTVPIKAYVAALSNSGAPVG